ncbi:MAG: hydroxypyruvate isomerase [Cyclobacteriaceae bacterium]|jgi:hydroxypyruvate isomerase
MKKRDALKLMVTGALATGLGSSFQSKNETPVKPMLKGNINHSVSRWCYSKIPLEELCIKAKAMGLVGIDLLKPSQWEVVQKSGLKCCMVNPEEFSLEEGFNDPRLHKQLQKKYKDLIKKASQAGIQNVICFSGNRRDGLSEEEGIKHCAEGLAPLVAYAEKLNVTVMMELLNSKVDHKGYQCDHTLWGVSLCKELGSEHFKLLYDIYHMQIMEGDIIRNIQDYHTFFGHYHTGGVPGRNEINETQELYYPAIMQAIVKTGYTGYVAQEFIPTKDDVLVSLQESIEICDV